MIAFLIFNRAWYAWGALGTFVVIAAVLLTIAWIHDKREAKRYEAPRRLGACSHIAGPSSEVPLAR